MRFFEKLKKPRLDNGVTQQQMAEALGKTKRFIRYYENKEGSGGIPPMDVQIPVVDLIPDLNVGTPKINIESLNDLTRLDYLHLVAYVDGKKVEIIVNKVEGER